MRGPRFHIPRGTPRDTERGTERGERGIALLNALIMVTAMAALAAGMMLRAETSRARQQDMQGTAQAALYLDAAEMLVAPVLSDDWKRDQSLDHLREGWALEDFDAEIDRGHLSGRITDLQGLFNVNTLSDPADLNALRAFERLLTVLDLPPDVAREVAGFVQARGPAQATDYAERALPVRPPNRPLDSAGQLREIRGMTSETYARLQPFVAALPADAPLNLNTAPRAVLAAVLPAADRGGLTRLLADRSRLPFANLADFDTRAARLVQPLVTQRALFPAAGVAVSSSWFAARFTVELDGLRQTRRLVVERSRLDGKVKVKRRAAVVQ